MTTATAYTDISATRQNKHSNTYSEVSRKRCVKTTSTNNSVTQQTSKLTY